MIRVGRRQFLVVAGALLAAPLARAQQVRRAYRIAIPGIATRDSSDHLIAALEQGLREHGYLPGKDVVIDYRSVEGNMERYPELVQEVVRSKPDVILTGTNVGTTAVKAATQSIPIVMTVGSDVIFAGYARSYAKPGGNITGIAFEFDTGVVVKYYELLKEIAPKISRVAALWDSLYSESFRERNQVPLDAAALALGLRVFPRVFSGDPEQDFVELTRLGADAVHVIPAARIFSQRAEIGALATKHRLPTAFPGSEYVDAGGLVSYGPNLAGLFRTAARFIDKILKGAKPGDIPIERPTVFDLTINLKTAKALGLKIPQVMLVRAHRVIE